MCLDPLLTNTFYYLDIDQLTSVPALKTNTPNGFKLDQANLPANWLSWWRSKARNRSETGITNLGTPDRGAGVGKFRG